MESTTRRELPRSRNWPLALIGALLVLGSIPAAGLLWMLLPKGVYPVVVVGVVALPLLWLGFYCLRRAGYPIESFARAHPEIFKFLVYLLAIVLISALVLFLDSKGYI